MVPTFGGSNPSGPVNQGFIMQDMKYSESSVHLRSDFLHDLDRYISKYALAYTEQQQRNIVEDRDMMLAIMTVIKEISGMLNINDIEEFENLQRYLNEKKN